MKKSKSIKSYQLDYFKLRKSQWELEVASLKNFKLVKRHYALEIN